MADVICPCGATSTHASDAHRCTKGHVLVGNRAAFKHGLRAFETRGEPTLPADLRVSVEDFRQQVVADRGGVENLTAIEAGYIRRLGELETACRLLAGDLASRGLFTPRGRVRGTFGRWLDVLQTWDRYASKLGLERRARSVTVQERLVEAARRAATEDRE
jgi:hypothetical protein